MVTNVATLLKNARRPGTLQASYQINVFDTDEQIVTGQVYAPDTLDAHGHFMSADELKNIAHTFMKKGLLRSVDFNHDNKPVNAVIVESFIARENDPDYEAGSWVVSMKIDDDKIWDMVKSGDINGFSFEIMTFKEPVDVEIEFKSWYYGFTDPDPRDKHRHPFLVRMDDSGGIAWAKVGMSDGPDGHTHVLNSSNYTGKTNGHSHRVHFK